MSKTTTRVQSAQTTCNVEEDEGYDVPFALFTWRQWQDMQAQTMQRFTRFQRAIEHKQVRLALQIALEMQQMTTEWFKEAASWIGIHEDV